MKRAFWMGLLGLVSATAPLAQEHVNVTPIKTEPAVAAQRWNTSSVQPQIIQSYRTGFPMPANPKPDTRPVDGPSNNLVAGGMSSTKRTNLKARFPGIGFTGFVPPDPQSAVSATHVVQVVNSDIAFFLKGNGQKIFQVSMEPLPGAAEGFFESLNPVGFVFDPKVLFDPNSGRFFVVALEVDFGTEVSKVLVAVSDDGDPTGVWNKYRFEAKVTQSGTTSWMDYPSIALNKDGFVVSGNNFGFSSGFAGVQLLVIPKAPLVAGTPATSSSIMVNDGFTLQPGRTWDNNVDKIYLASTTGNNSTIRLYALTNLATTPTLNSATVTVPAYAFPGELAPSVNGRFLDNIGNRLLDADWFAGKFVTAHTVAVSNSDDRNAVRWYEFNTNDFPTAQPTFSQAGTLVGSAGQSYLQPSVGINSVGDTALVFTRSSTSIVADVMVAGRKATDPAGTMGAATLVQGSNGSQYGDPGFNRWGDYGSMEVDPSDNVTFWSTSMIADTNTLWLAVFHKLTISEINPNLGTTNLDADTVGIFTDPNSVPNTQGGGLTGNVADLSVSDNANVLLNSVSSPRLGQIAAIEMTFTVEPTPGGLKFLGTRIEANAPTGTTGMVWLYDYVSQRYVQLKSWRMGPTGNTAVDAQVSRNFNRYVQNGQAKMVFRALVPSRRGNVGAPFQVSIDLAKLRIRT